VWTFEASLPAKARAFFNILVRQMCARTLTYNVVGVMAGAAGALLLLEPRILLPRRLLAALSPRSVAGRLPRFPHRLLLHYKPLSQLPQLVSVLTCMRTFAAARRLCRAQVRDGAVTETSSMGFTVPLPPDGHVFDFMFDYDDFR
jgi:hypothetical protein